MISSRREPGAVKTRGKAAKSMTFSDLLWRFRGWLKVAMVLGVVILACEAAFFVMDLLAALRLIPGAP